MNARRKLPDCETPLAATHDTLPATGFGVPMLSCAALLKKVATSRNAAKPIPRTYGSFAVNASWYSSFGSKPFFRQICVGSGVPGNGLVALHFAHAQSVLGIVVVAPMVPSGFSDACVVSVAFVV